MVLPQVPANPSTVRGRAIEHKNLHPDPIQTLLSSPWLLITNHKPSAAVQGKAEGIPAYRSYSPAIPSWRLGSRIYVTAEFQAEPYLCTASCKTAGATAAQHAASIPGGAVGTLLAKVKLTPLPGSPLTLLPAFFLHLLGTTQAANQSLSQLPTSCFGDNLVVPPSNGLDWKTQAKCLACKGEEQESRKTCT